MKLWNLVDSSLSPVVAKLNLSVYLHNIAAYEQNGQAWM